MLLAVGFKGNLYITTAHIVYFQGGLSKWRKGFRNGEVKQFFVNGQSIFPPGLVVVFFP